VVPSLRQERRLLRAGYGLVAGMDEVGRGALAGPVSVGVVVVDAATRTAPAGVRDSKLLTATARQELVPRIRGWAVAHAVGHSWPEEIDRFGIIGALRLAGRRALAALPALPGCVVLDGSHDWLTAPATLFDLVRATPGGSAREFVAVDHDPYPAAPPVVTMVKADLRCAAVAAASILAKVERDDLMVELAQRCPGYGWEDNKGYAAPDHVAGLRRVGPSSLHRRSWRLPGVDSGVSAAPVRDAGPAVRATSAGSPGTGGTGAGSRPGVCGEP
jgi:ribonuclease HII